LIHFYKRVCLKILAIQDHNNMWQKKPKWDEKREYLSPSEILVVVVV